MDNDTIHEIFAHEHHSGGNKHTTTCSQCGAHLPFKMSHRLGWTLNFIQPHDCETKEALRP